MDQNQSYKETENDVQSSIKAGDYGNLPRGELNSGLHLQPRLLSTDDPKDGCSYVDACCVHAPSTSTKDGTNEETQAGYPFGGAAEPETTNLEVQAASTEARRSARIATLSAELLQGVQHEGKRLVCAPPNSPVTRTPPLLNSEVNFARSLGQAPHYGAPDTYIQDDLYEDRNRANLYGSCGETPAASVSADQRHTGVDKIISSTEYIFGQPWSSKRDSKSSATLTSVFDSASADTDSVDADPNDDESAVFTRIVCMDDAGGWKEVS